MKKYFLHNGADQQGPFDFEDLKSKNISKKTPIWYEGLTDWTTAGKIIELNDLFNSIPPPFETKSTTSVKTVVVQQPIKKSFRPMPEIIGAVILIICGILYFSNQNSGGNSLGSQIGETYQEKVMSVEEIERSQPTNFLTADGTYNQNLFGTKLKVHGVITNKATVATYKDAIVRVTYYSKTKTELGTNDYTIYDMFPPNSSVNFELKIQNYKEVNTIGWEVVSALSK